MKKDDLYKKQDEELQRLGITDPHQREAVLDFLYRLVEIAVDEYFRNENKHHD